MSADLDDAPVLGDDRRLAVARVPLGGGVRLVLAGELDAYSADRVVDALADIEPSIDIEFDLGMVTFLDSTGLRCIIAERRRRDGTSTVTIGARTTVVDRLLDVAGLASFFAPPEPGL